MVVLRVTTAHELDESESSKIVGCVVGGSLLALGLTG